MANLLSINQIQQWWNSENTRLLLPINKSDVCFLGTPGLRTVECSNVCIVSAKVLDSPTKLVVKPTTPSNIGPNAFIEVYQQTSNAKLAPKLIATGEGFDCFEFIEGDVLTSVSTDTLWLLDCSAQFIAGLHSFSQTLDPVQKLNARLNLKQLMENLLLSCQPQFSTQYDDLLAFVDTTTGMFDNYDLVVSHGDLNWGNLIKTPNGINAIDWEFFGCAPIEYDFAMTLSVNQIEPNNLDVLFTLYRDKYHGAGAINPARFNQYLAICHLLNGFWYISQGSTSKELDYLQLGKDYIAAANKLIPLKELMIFDETKWL